MAKLTTAPDYDHNAYAAASSSSASSSASFSCSRFDVFINHRGPDVKDNFASHLYRRLIDRGLSVFLDREVLEEGHNISSQIKRAIDGASVHIAIFSARYAESSWCLNELVLMKNSQATILPIFFKVDPSVVRHPEKDGTYAEALRNLQEKKTSDPQTGEEKPRYGSDTIQNWRTTLSYVAGLSGFHLNKYNGDEGELLDDVLQTVSKSIPKGPLYVAQYLTGLDLKLEEFTKIVLQDHEEQLKPKVVGIVGVGGVGKTTLATAFFNSNRSNYNEYSFIINVREMSLNILRSKLIEGLKLGNIQKSIRKHPSSCHALIVLDDVTDTNHREALLTIKGFLSPESLILVTSRDKHILQSYGVLEGSLYHLKGLNIPQSKQLFCSFAFNQPHPQPEFADLVDRFVKACGGLPLSLRVVGALVYQRQYEYWEEQLVRLQSNLPRKIESCFRISYDSLEENDKSIFLDIACFFIGKDKDKAIRIWGNVGLQNLWDKCLIDVDSDNKIDMHDHIRDMGRQIAKEVMQRRIWRSTTSIRDDLLQQLSPGTNGVCGISMASSSLFRDKHSDLSSTSKSSQISWTKSSEIRHLSHNFHFSELRLVVTEEDHLEDILREHKPPLIWLRWYGYSHSSLPDWIPMTKLRVLEMQGSTLNTLWSHQSQVLPLDLKELSISAPLSEIPRSIERLTYLERITIWNHSEAAVEVERLPDEFCRLCSLRYLIFKGFSRMVSLPVSFGQLTNLQFIDLEGASSLLALPNSFGNLNRLKHLSLKGCENLTISNETLGDIRTLEYLDLSSCRKVIELPPQVSHQRSLQHLYLQETNLKEFPSAIGDLCNLEVLKLSGNLLDVLPPWLGDLKKLKILSLYGLPQLKSLPDSIGRLSQLTHLDIKRGGIEYLPEHLLLEMKNLESLVVSACPLQELPFKAVEVERETVLSLQGERAMNRLNSSNGFVVCQNLQISTSAAV